MYKFCNYAYTSTYYSDIFSTIDNDIFQASRKLRFLFRLQYCQIEIRDNADNNKVDKTTCCTKTLF